MLENYGVARDDRGPAAMIEPSALDPAVPAPTSRVGAQVLLVALAAVAAPSPGNAAAAGQLAAEDGTLAGAIEAAAPPQAAATAKRLLAFWRETVGAPETELRRSGRRLAAALCRLPAEDVEEACAKDDPTEGARALVAECGRLDRDFAWDVPLRDISRAIVEAAIRAVRAYR
jgi:hypothetical protein